MADALIYLPAAAERWRTALQQRLPDWRFWLHDEDYPSAAIAALIGWNPPAGLFERLTGLRAVLALGAGVDGFLKRSDLPAKVPLLRLEDAGMAEQMVEYVLLGVLAWQRHLGAYAAQQQRAEWRPLPRRSRRSLRLTVLGLGVLGGAVAEQLAAFGYPTAGWSRRSRALAGVDCRAGDQALPELLQRSDVVINLLPSTAATRGLLNAERLAWLPPQAYLIHASRGDQLDTDALLAALQDGRLGGAQLDVFAEEPLPPEHPLWRHPQVRITPHVAALTVLDDSLAQVVANLQRLQRGQPLLAAVDRQRGY